MATIYIENKANIDIKRDLDTLDRIVGEAELPQGVIVFVFNDTALPDRNQGACLPKSLEDFSKPYKRVCKGTHPGCIGAAPS